jgi:hypothetical protein
MNSRRCNRFKRIQGLTLSKRPGANMAGGGPVGGVRDNADRPWSFRRVFAAQFALGPRTGPPPRPLARGRPITSLGGKDPMSGPRFIVLPYGVSAVIGRPSYPTDTDSRAAYSL